MTERVEAVMLIMTAFWTAAPERVNTPTYETVCGGIGALHTLGVTASEIDEAARAMGWS